MKFDIYAKPIEITKGLQEHIQNKVDKLDKYFNTEPEDAKITLKVEKNLHKADLTIHFGGKMLRVEKQTEDMYKTIDALVNKMETKLRRYHEKLNKQYHQEGLRTRVQAYAEQEEQVERELYFEEHHNLVRTKRMQVKPMSVSEALLEMELTDHDFYVFLNQETKQINIVYQRRNGKNGLIETEYV